MFYFDVGYLYFVLPALILAIYAQFKVSSTFNRFQRVRNERGYSANVVARALLDDAGLQDVPIEHVRGNLTDHYDPKTKVLRLSDSVYNSSSIAALGVAAHEVGHAIQHADEYAPLSVRNMIFPIANIGSSLAFPLFFIGLLFNFGILMNLGILFFGLAFLFQLVTLPVEFNASSRALALLSGGGYLSDTEVRGSKKVLNAAALTYVASAVMALAQLLRLLLLARSRD